MTAALAVAEPEVIAATRAVILKRTLDAALLNTVVNHPEVRPWIAPGNDKLDLTLLIADPANYALVSDGGGFLLINHGGGIYEVHTQFLPEHRSRVREAMWAGFDYMFTRTDCERVVTQVPDDNAPARSLAEAAGFRPMFRREQGYRGPTAYMGLHVDEWSQANAALEVDGEWFHQQLEQAKRQSGSKLEQHGHDPSHERAVGAAVRMIRAGNAAKGVAFYNRWARLAGYAPIALISAQPIVVDVRDAVVAPSGEKMEILLCR